uniref:Mitochondrial ribonuclease P protein 3 n=1 Tax=Phallusia mammillata TaxID=59560 RepID=A0A6F9DGK4_9ASCI|nr:mitochondrial ribonuclease P protein 3 [Phallusia mammillata]
MIARQLLKAATTDKLVSCCTWNLSVKYGSTAKHKRISLFKKRAVFKTDLSKPSPTDLRYIDWKLDGVDEIKEGGISCKEGFPTAAKKNPKPVIDIPPGYNSIEVWDEVLEEVFSNSPYGRNVVQRSIMLFLLRNCPLNTNSHSESELSRTLQSFLDYLVEKPEALEVCQSSLWYYLKSCRENGQTHKVLPLLRLLKDKIKTWAPKFLEEIIQHDLKDDQDVVDYFVYMVSVSCDKYLKHEAISFLLRANKKEDAVKMMREQMEVNARNTNAINIQDKVLNTFLDTFSYSEDGDVWAENRDVVENFLLLMSQSYFVFKHHDSAAMVAEWFKRIPHENWAAKTFSAIQVRDGLCPVSGVKMIPSILSEKEHQLLKNASKKSLLNQNIQINRYAPAEFKPTKHWKWQSDSGTKDKDAKKFIELLLERGPFDLVIDGANVIHTYKTKDVAFKAIRRFVKDFRAKVKKDAKVVFMARDYSAGELNRAYPDFAQTIDQCYLNPRTEDDSYILYTAICSGRNCYVLSNDLFRNYKHFFSTHLTPTISLLFHKFQSSMQITFEAQLGGHLEVQFGSSVFPQVQQTDRTWHFPFQYLDGPRYGKVHILPRHYLCVYRKDLLPQSS